MYFFNVLTLLALFIPAAAFAEETSTVPQIRYFQYWMKIDRPGEYKSLSYSLMNSRMDVYGPQQSFDFSGPVDKSVLKEFSSLLTELDLQGWDGTVTEEEKAKGIRDAFDLSRMEDGKKCVWSMKIVFADNPHGNTPEPIEFFGMDDDNSPKRLQAEEVLTNFFRKQCEIAQAATPRHIEIISYTTLRKDKKVYYSLSVEEDMVRLSRDDWQGGYMTEYVSADLLPKLDALLKEYTLDTWHGFKGAEYDYKAQSAFELHVQFDTVQKIIAKGNSDKSGGTPANFAEVDTKLRALLDNALGGDNPVMLSDEELGNVREFSYSSSGMSMDSFITYRIYHRRDADGPHVILRRQRGLRQKAAEVILDTAALQGIETCIRDLNLLEWNGFRGNNKYVLDGEGFGLSVKFADGTEINASGSNAFPKEYGKRMDGLLAFLDGLIENSAEAE